MLSTPAHVQPQRQLLYIGDGEACHIVPTHQEVAAWYATIFDDLLRDDPLILLLGRPAQPARHRTGAHSGSVSSAGGDGPGGLTLYRGARVG